MPTPRRHAEVSGLSGSVLNVLILEKICELLIHRDKRNCPYIRVSVERGCTVCSQLLKLRTYYCDDLLSIYILIPQLKYTATLFRVLWSLLPTQP